MRIYSHARKGTVGVLVVGMLAGAVVMGAVPVTADDQAGSDEFVAPHTPHNGDSSKDMAGAYWDPQPASRAALGADSWPKPSTVISKLKKYGISGSKLVLEKDYDQQGPENNANLSGMRGKMEAFMFHDTGTGVPASRLNQKHSLNWIMNGVKSSSGKTVRACHFYVDRKGIVHVVYLGRTWHAGAGVSMWNGAVPRNSMNGYSMGVEIESQGGGANDLTAAQIDSATRIGAAALEAAGLPLSRAINHKTYSGWESDPGRDSGGSVQGKVDTRQSASWWRSKVNAVRTGKVTAPAPAPSKPSPAVAPLKAGQVKMSHLKSGARNESVKRYQVALRNYLSKRFKLKSSEIKRMNPSGATGYYGVESRRLTKKAMLQISKTRTKKARAWLNRARTTKGGFPTRALIARLKLKAIS